MKKILALTLTILMTLFLTGCFGGDSDDKSKKENEPAPTEKKSASEMSKDEKSGEKMNISGKKILVVYYSRTGDNYEVGNIAKGNTHIVADMIVDATGADTFEIKPVKPYPEDYEECTRVAKAELQENARPEIVGKIENFGDYDTIFLGYPNWWSDMPMMLYTFLESYDFSGKTIIPFCTSSSESFIGREEIQQYAKGATVLEGLGVRGKRCQDDPESVRKDVNNWLKKVMP